jgi:hypothetical protein
MGVAGQERTGTLILRAWIEDYGDQTLRVRVTWVIQGRANEPVSSASATVDGVCAIVRDWLEELLREAEPGSPCAPRN